MATAAMPGAMPGMTILPQFAGDALRVQRQQMLANALMQQSMQNQGAQLNQTGAGMRVMPRISPLQPLIQALGGYYAGKMGNEAIDAQNALGRNQWNALVGDQGGSPFPQQQAPASPPQDAQSPGQSDPQALAQALQQGPQAVPAQPPVQGQPLPPQAAPQPPMGAAPQGMPPQMPPQVPQQRGMLSPGGPMNPAGIPTTTAAMMYLQSPDKYWEAQAQQYKPTDMALMLQQAGIDKNSPLGRQVMQQAIVKANNIPLVSGRAGAPMYDYQGNVIAMAPKIPDNAIPTIQNGQVTGVTALPGGASIEQSNSQAQASGKAAVTPVSGFDAAGNPTFTNALAASQGGASPGGVVDGRYPGAAQGGAVRPGLTPAAQAASSETGKAAAQQLANDNTGANGFASRMFTLNKALTGLQGANTGPGSDALNNVKSFIAARGIPGVDVNKIASYDEANKYLMQYAIGQAGALGEGTDGKLAATLSGNANTHISNLAAQDVVRANMGLERMKQAQVQQFNNQGLPPEQYQKWSTQWNKQVNPQVFVWDSLPTDKKQAAMANMSPTQRQGFTQQYNWALQNKFIDGPQ